MVRHTTGTATEIRPQCDLNPVLSSTFQLAADMQLSDQEANWASVTATLLYEC